MSLDQFLPIDSRSASPNSLASSVRSSSALSHRSSHHPGGLSLGSTDDLYRSSFGGGGHTRNSSNASTYSLSGTNLTTPNDSPPMDFSQTSQQLKGLGGAPGRQTQIRRARHESSNPYTRASSFSGSESGVRSSSSEAEDINPFAFSPHQSSDYGNLYRGSSQGSNAGIGPLDTTTQHQATGAFQRMSISPDHALEALAANVRAATTTSASDRAKHIFVQAWLNANYAPYPDGNVPRQGLYNSYRRVCDEHRIPHVNTATLGKAIRLCFPAIKTRRLGVRGNSKYHYCGIRPATSAEAEWLQDFIKRTSNHRPAGSRPTSQSGRSSTTDESPDDDDEDGEDGSGSGGGGGGGGPRGLQHLSIHGTKSPALFAGDDKTPTVNRDLASAQGAAPQGYRSGEAQIRRRSPPVTVSSNVPPHMRPQARNPPSLTSTVHGQSVRTLHNFPNIEDAIGHQASSVSGGSPQSAHGIAAREVWRWFEDHLDALMESVRAFRFDQFEMHLRTFWAGLGPEYREIVHAPAVAGLMARADAIVYDEILEVLRSQMLTPIPAPTLTSLRQLADKMEKVLLGALKDYGSTFVEPKVELGARFGHLVLRFLDIFQVTQALSSVLSNPKQLVDMSRSWRDIDFESVRNQAALVCNCRHEDLHQLLEVDFVGVLDGLQSSPEPVREIMAWSDLCCERLMGAHGGVLGHEDRATMSSRSLLIRWGYVTSQIMRDLTIRSDPAFGAFQILKLFMDDWIALNVLRSVALSTNSVAASVEPVIQQQFLALSPGGPQYGHNLDPNQHHQSHHGMSNTPTSSLMGSGMHDPFSSAQHSLVDPSSHFPYDSLSFGPMDATASAPSPADSLLNSSQTFADFGSGAGNSSSYDFGSHNITLDAPPMPSTSSSASSSGTDVGALRGIGPSSGSSEHSDGTGSGSENGLPMNTDQVKSETSV